MALLTMRAVGKVSVSTEARSQGVPLRHLAIEHHLAPKTLRRLVEVGAVRHVWKSTGSGGVTRYRLDRAQLKEDLAALLSCRLEGCCAMAPGASGYCATHRSLGARERTLATMGLDRERDWLALAEAARDTRWPRDRIRSAIESGELEATWSGLTWRIPRVSFMAWDAEQRRTEEVAAGKLTPRQTAKLFRLDRHRLMKAAKAGRVRVHTSADRFFFDPEELRHDLESLQCHAEGCSAVALGQSGHCMAHRQLGRYDEATRQDREKAYETACRLYRDGLPMTEIVEATGLGARAIQNAARARGLVMRIPGGMAPLLIRRKESAGLLTTKDVAQDAWLTAVGTILFHVRSGRLAPAEVMSCNRGAMLFAPQDVERFIRETVRASAHARAFLDPDRVVRIHDSSGRTKLLADELGVSLDDSRSILRGRAERRRHHLLPHRRGRRPKAGPSTVHQRWAALFEESRAEDDRKQDTDWDIVQAVAELDWQDHPEDWPRSSYPAAHSDPEALDPAFLRPAADRVRNGLKLLVRARK